MAKYSDEFRAECVAHLIAEGYPDNLGALTKVANRTGVTDRSLRRWFKHENNPPPEKLVRQKTEDLAALFRDEVYEIMDILPEKRKDASYKELTTSAAIFVDKIQLLEDKPTSHTKLSGGLELPNISDDELDDILHAGGDPGGKNGKVAPPSQGELNHL